MVLGSQSPFYQQSSVGWMQGWGASAGVAASLAL